MAKTFIVTPYSLLLTQPSPGRSSVVYSSAVKDYTSAHRLRNAISSSLGIVPHRVCRQGKPKGFVRVGPDSLSTARSSIEDIELQPDSTGGEGFSVKGGGGGGAGGRGGGGSGGSGGNNNKKGGDGEFDKDKRSTSKMSMSQKLTLAYAALVGVGGVMGYLKSGSQKSLISGGVSALLLYYVHTQLPTRPAFASFLGFGLSAALLFVMGSRFKNSGKIFPAGVVSLVSLVMTGGYLHGIMRGAH